MEASTSKWQRTTLMCLLYMEAQSLVRLHFALPLPDEPTYMCHCFDSLRH